MLQSLKRKNSMVSSILIINCLDKNKFKYEELSLKKLCSIISLSLCIGIFLVLLTSCSIKGAFTSNPSNLHPTFSNANSSYGYIDDSGKFVIKQQFLQAGDFNLSGYAIVTTNDYKQGVIDKTGHFIIEPLYDRFDFFINTPAFQNGTSVFNIYEKDGTPLYGMINISGKVIIKPGNWNLNDFSEDIAVANDNLSVAHAFDTTGKLIFKCNGYLGNFHDGLATFTNNDGILHGYVNESGKVVIKQQYIYASDFNDGKAEVKATDGEYYDIDKTGKILDKKSSDDLNGRYRRFDDGYYIKFEGAGYCSLYDKSGIAIIYEVYSIGRINANYYKVIKENSDNKGLLAIFNNAGRQLTDYIYTNAIDVGNGIIAVTSNEQTYLIDENLKEIKGFQKLKGSWNLSLSGNMIKADVTYYGYSDCYSNIRYYTKTGHLVFQSDGTYPLNNGEKISCGLYVPDTVYDIPNITYPKISLLKNKNIEQSINIKLYNYFINNSSNTNFNFEQISNILNIQLINGKNTSASIGQIQKDYCFDLTTGNEYSFNDLFKKGSNYKTYIQEIIKKIEISGAYNGYMNKYFEFDNLTGFMIYKDRIRFYGLVEPSPKIAAPLSIVCDITYNQLDNYIDKSGDLWKNIQEWKNN
jgi:hypothetical protein